MREALSLADDQGVTEAMAAAAILVEDIDLPADQRAALEEARAARSRADEAVRKLHIEGGLSVRDVGELLGVSGAMVHKRAKAIVSALRAKT